MRALKKKKKNVPQRQGMKNQGFFSYKYYIHNEPPAWGMSQQIRGEGKKHKRKSTQEVLQEALRITGRTIAQCLRSGF